MKRLHYIVVIFIVVCIIILYINLYYSTQIKTFEGFQQPMSYTYSQLQQFNLFSTLYAGTTSNFGNNPTCAGSAVIDGISTSTSDTITNYNKLHISYNVTVTNNNASVNLDDKNYILIFGAVDNMGEVDLKNTYSVNMPYGVKNTVEIKNSISPTATICNYNNFMIIVPIIDPTLTSFQKFTVTVSETNVSDSTVRLPPYSTLANNATAFTTNYLPFVKLNINIPTPDINSMNPYLGPFVPIVLGGDIVYGLNDGTGIPVPNGGIPIAAGTGPTNLNIIDPTKTFIVGQQPAAGKQPLNPFMGISQKIGTTSSDASSMTFNIDTSPLYTVTNGVNSYFQIPSISLYL